jgi:membrane protein DedA with SNARE-associated domain
VNLTEYIILFVLAATTGAGVPGPGDASVIAAGTLAGEGRLKFPVFMLGALVAGVWWMGLYVGLSYFLGAEIAERIGNAGAKAVLGVAVVAAAGLGIKVGLSKWRAARQSRESEMV